MLTAFLVIVGFMALTAVGLLAVWLIFIGLATAFFNSR